MRNQGALLASVEMIIVVWQTLEYPVMEELIRDFSPVQVFLEEQLLYLLILGTVTEKYAPR